MFKSKLKEANLLRWQKGNREMFAGTLAALMYSSMLPFFYFFLPEAGASSWIYFLGFPVFMGTMFFVIYRRVGTKMDSLRRRVAQNPELQSDCLMLRGSIQSPAVAQIFDDRLLLTPLVGEIVEVPLEGLAVKEVSGRFNGAVYPGATAFWLECPEVSSRLAFAVPNGEAWRDYFA